MKYRHRDYLVNTEQISIEQSFEMNKNQKCKPCKCNHQKTDHNASMTKRTFCEWSFCRCEKYEEKK